jgi:hypothetical protein
MALGKSALKVATTQVGQCENPLGSNWGTPVKDYLASVGINFPASWCMAFVYWCFNSSIKNDPSFKTDAVKNNPLVKTGGVLMAWNSADKKYRVTGEPQPGDIFIMDYGKGLGHTGIVEKTDPTFIYTIEGNTNDTGSREGIMVCRKQRPRKKIKGYLRY